MQFLEGWHSKTTDQTELLSQGVFPRPRAAGSGLKRVWTIVVVFLWLVPKEEGS